MGCDDMQGNYRDLKVYEKAYVAAKAVYMNLTPKFPREEKYGLTDQIKRASISIALNIAEGYGKGDSKKEFVRYLNMARGSVNEVLVILEFVKDLGYINEVEYNKAEQAYTEIGKMLTGLIRTQEN